MKALFADTFFGIALTNVRDQAHEEAKAFARSTEVGAISTTEEVLTEYLNYFAGRGPVFRRKSALNVESIYGSPTVRVIAQTSESFLAGLGLYRARADKGYSLTDCISMEAMRKQGMTDALTTDSHFDQEGFRAVLRASRS
jgi:uncharacterized protein